jgi:2-oxoglutarate ferredoxin oxidoreductase subunit alpha
MMGNFALVEGALAAGCDFFAGYPITPANEISEHMSARMAEVGGAFLQGEDELCSIYAVTGASLAGAKAMTATASAGYNYMQEGIEYAVAGEIPCVIVDVQRCRGENFATQADVMQARWGAAGDHEMVVLCPSSVQELFDYTIRAFNLAEKYRTPVVVLSETTIALMRENLTIPPREEIEVYDRAKPTDPPEQFIPYAADPKGVPPLPDFGDGYRILHSINPHDETGSISWNPDAYERLYQRITEKITANYDDIVRTSPYCLDDARIGIIAYGSECRPAREAVDLLRGKGVKAGLLKLDTIWPVPYHEIRALSEQCDVIFAVEMNIGKYAGEIERVVFGRCEVERIGKNRGLIHTVGEIVNGIEKKMGVRTW